MKIKSLKLTLVIPAYNESRHLKLCLDAVSLQTILPDEVIVVDNNSTDKTVEIAKKYSFVKVVSEKKQGIYFARNKGFNTARGEIIARIDADSIIPKNWVEHIKDFYADESHADRAWTSAGYFYNLRMPKVSGWFISQIAYRFNRLLMGHYILWGSTMAITQEQWKAVRPITCARNDIHEDLDLAIHLHELGYKINYDSGINVAVYVRRVLADRHKLWDYLQLWPQTLKVHHMRTWVFGWIGAAILYILSPYTRLNEQVDRLSKSKLYQRLKLN